MVKGRRHIHRAKVRLEGLFIDSHKGGKHILRSNEPHTTSGTHTSLQFHQLLLSMTGKGLFLSFISSQARDRTACAKGVEETKVMMTQRGPTTK